MILHHHTIESGSSQSLADRVSAAAKSLPVAVPADRDPVEPRPFDITTGLQNNFHRHYDPTPGRWIDDAPIGYDSSDKNLTKYVGQ